MADSLSLPVPPRAMRRLSGWLDHLGISRLAFDDTLGLLSPLLTVNRLHARVVDKVVETPGACTLILQAGPAFTGLKPGQFMLFGVTINGALHRRAYSPRAIEGRAGRFAITVQRQLGGLVSHHLNDKAQVGDVLTIEPADGAFVLPDTPPAEVLFIAGGSGITPCMAMLEHLERQAPRTQATLIYFARSHQDRIFAKALEDMARRWSQFHYVPVDSIANTPGTSAPASQRVLDAALLDQTFPAWRSLPTYCCGPAPLMNAARELWASADASARLRLEAFAPPVLSTDDTTVHTVRVARDHHTKHYPATGNQTLLVAGEQAGLSLKHGCRQGICHECTCRLVNGSVRDLTSGERIDGEGQPIRLCVSAAMSDLDLESLN